MRRRQHACPSSCPSQSSAAFPSLPGSLGIEATASASSTASTVTSRTLSCPRDSSRLFRCWHQARKGRRFACSQPPDRVTLFGLQLRVRHARPRPLQCRQCSRFGHVSEACSLVGACIRCGRQHPAADSCSVRCVNCERGAFSRHVDLSSLAGGAGSGHGPDPALETGGQGRTIREECREVRSYAAAVRANLPESPSKDPGLQRPTTAPIFPANGEPVHNEPIARYTRRACGGPAGRPHRIPARCSARGPRCADNPLRAVCLTALGGQPGSTQLN
ncbi:hypothetical protein HPB51_001747 [Rhipicephalus microplus]|uniref:CCHC-type domain-containing protein n=1 Tax=Rhipicephalus microplus TaxID=6941 RepID=A0A9J6DES2_RHIMP|nr:hypothetical protein HPB51_001747 [Rhipicephalus microplus]